MRRHMDPESSDFREYDGESKAESNYTLKSDELLLSVVFNNKSLAVTIESGKFKLGERTFIKSSNAEIYISVNDTAYRHAVSGYPWSCSRILEFRQYRVSPFRWTRHCMVAIFFNNIQRTLSQSSLRHFVNVAVHRPLQAKVVQSFNFNTRHNLYLGIQHNSRWEDKMPAHVGSSEYRDIDYKVQRFDTAEFFCGILKEIKFMIFWIRGSITVHIQNMNKWILEYFKHISSLVVCDE